MQLDGYPPALSSAQVAEILGVSRTLVWRLIKSGELPSFRVGRLDRVPRAAIEELLNRGMPGPAPRPAEYEKAAEEAGTTEHDDGLRGQPTGES